MLTIRVPDKEFWDSKKNEFCTIKGQELQLEHSLISISKWESKWHIPFLNDNKRIKAEKSNEQIMDYIRCMTINKVADDRVYYCLTQENLKAITDYCEDPMTATTFTDKKSGGNPKALNTSGTFMTNEIIYYQMYKLGIHHDWEKRHINRLLTLIRVMAEKEEQANNPKKMPHAEAAKQQRALHAARRKH